VTSPARFFAYALSALLLGCFGTALSALPASATVTTLCTGYAACERAGMSSAGYADANRSMYWQMYSGHNCTNYVAYRMIRSGMPNSRPWSGGGNATYWGTSMSSITDSTPAVGAVAWWKAGVRPAGSAGHVAYVERVVSADEIIVSQDSWGGDFSWARITRASSGWPSGFIHFNDVALTSTAKPVITGAATVGSLLSASTGSWSQTGLSTSYQWRAGGADIAGAASSTFRVPQSVEGKRVKVRVTATKAGYPASSVLSKRTTVVAPGVLTSTTPPTIAGTPVVEGALTAQPGAWDPVPDSVTYQWSAGGTPLQGAVQPSLKLDATLVGKPVAVTVTARRAGYADASATSSATAAVAAATLTPVDPPAMSGTPQPGQTLTVTPGSTAPRATSSVQWLRAGVPVAGATSSSYRLTSADLGARISAQVQALRPGFTPLRVRTPATKRIKLTPTVQTSFTPGTGRLDATVTVRADGALHAPVLVRLKEAGAVIGTAALTNGSASLRVTGLAAGTHTFTLVVPATRTVAKAVLERVVTIR
jgi:surface antigen